MAAVAPAQATGAIASCQVVRKSWAAKEARGAASTRITGALNGAACLVAARDVARRTAASDCRGRGQVRCALAEDVHTRDQDDIRTYKGFERPDSFGRYGVYGGKYVPETLMAALTNLEVSYRATIKDPEFQVGIVVSSCCPTPLHPHHHLSCFSRPPSQCESCRILTFFFCFCIVRRRSSTPSSRTTWAGKLLCTLRSVLRSTTNGTAKDP
jgi:hypothetical protein